jgi:hypothetical protein
LSGEATTAVLAGVRGRCRWWRLPRVDGEGGGGREAGESTTALAGDRASGGGNCRGRGKLWRPLPGTGQAVVAIAGHGASGGSDCRGRGKQWWLLPGTGQVAAMIAGDGAAGRRRRRRLQRTDGEAGDGSWGDGASGDSCDTGSTPPS